MHKWTCWLRECERPGPGRMPLPEPSLRPTGRLPPPMQPRANRFTPPIAPLAMASCPQKPARRRGLLIEAKRDRLLIRRFWLWSVTRRCAPSSLPAGPISASRTGRAILRAVPMSDQEVTDVVSWLSSQRPGADGSVAANPASDALPSGKSSLQRKMEEDWNE